MKKNTWILCLVLAVLISTPSLSQAIIITDPDSSNFDWAGAQFEYRDYGNTSIASSGLDTKKGVYFYLESIIVPGGFLQSINDVLDVKVKHVGTGNKYTLVYGNYNWMGQNQDSWWLQVRPAEWMFEGRWKYILSYTGTDGRKHAQFYYVDMGPASFPQPPAYIRVNQTVDSYIVSWAGIGDPVAQPIDYRVRVFDGNGDGIEDYHGVWNPGGTADTGTHDLFTNEVSFPVPSIYGTSNYTIRLENRLNGHRACYYLKLPVFIPQ